MPNDDVLKRVDEKRILINTTAERRSSMVAYLVRHSNWFTTLIEEMMDGRSGKCRFREEYKDEIQGGRRYVAIREGRNSKSTSF